MYDQLARQIHILERRLDDFIKPEIPVVKGVAVNNSANIAVPNAAWTALTFNQERWDDNDFHSVVVNTSRLTVPTGCDGWYAISGHIEWAANTTGRRHITVQLNGATYIARLEFHDPDNLTLAQSVATLYYLSDNDAAANDYVELVVYQNSGGALNVNASANFSPEFRMVWFSR